VPVIFFVFVQSDEVLIGEVGKSTALYLAIRKDLEKNFQQRFANTFQNLGRDGVLPGPFCL